MTTLSICIPSHAPLAAARPSIDAALALLRHEDIEVVVSDNSGDVEKAAVLGSMSISGFRYLVSPHEEVMRNWSHAVENSEGKFVMMLGDDDMVVALPDFRTPGGIALDNAIGFRPSHVMFTTGLGVSRPTNFAVAGSRAVDRVQDFLVRNGGSAVTLYSAIRREWWREIFDGYLAHHPTRALFTDWSMTFALVASAPLLAEGNLVYLYNNANWSTEEKIRENSQRGIEIVGLPPEAAQIQMALQAVDAFVAVCRRELPLPADEKLEAGLLVASVYFNSLVTALQKIFESGTNPSPKLVQTAKIALGATNPAEQLGACLVIVELWLPHLRERYQAFFNAVLDPAVATKVGFVEV